MGNDQRRFIVNESRACGSVPDATRLPPARAVCLIKKPFAQEFAKSQPLLRGALELSVER